MYFDENIINETMTYIINGDYDSEVKKTVLNTLSNQPIDVKKNILFWSRTPLFKVLSKDKEFVYKFFDKCIELHTFSYKFRKIYEKFIDLKEFFRQDFVLEYCKEYNAIEYFSFVEGFFDFYDGELQKELVDEYVSYLSFQNLYVLNKFSENIFSYVVDNLEYDKKELLIKTFIYSNYGDLDEHIEKKLFEISKDRLESISLNEKINFIKNLSNTSIKREAFYYMKLDNNLDLVISSLIKEISSYVSEDILLQKLIENQEQSNDIYQSYLQSLSTEYQIKALKALADKKIPINRVEFYLKNETLKILFEEYNIIPGNHCLYSLYKEYNNIEFLKAIKNDYMKSVYIDIDILCEDDFVNLLNDVEKQIIINKLSGKKSFSIPNNQVKYNDFFFKEYKKIMIKYYNDNPLKKVFFTVKNLMELFNLDEQLILIKHYDIKDIIDTAIDSDENLDFILSLLEHNTNIINEGLKNNVSSSNIYMSKSRAERLVKIIDFIDSEYLSFVISKETVEKISEINKCFYDNIASNPDLVSEIDLLDLLNEEQLNNVLDKINIRNLERLTLLSIDLSLWKQYSDILFKYFYKRFDEYIEYKSQDGFFVIMSDNKLFDYLDDKHKQLFVLQVKSVNTLSSIIKKNCEYTDLAIDKLLEIYENIIRKDYMESSDFHIKINLDSYNSDIVKKIIPKMNLLEAVYCYLEYPDIIIENQIVKRLSEHPEELVDETLTQYINKVYFSLSNENKEFIKNILDSYLNNNELYSNNLSKYIQGMDISDKIKFLYYYNRGYINDNYELIVNLLKNNPFLFKTIDNIIFNDDMKCINFRFIEKLSKYNKIEKVVRIISNDKNKFDFFIKCTKYLEEKNYSDVVFDKIIYSIISYINSTKKQKVDYNMVNENNIEDIIQFILYDYTNVEVIYSRLNNKKIYESIDEMFELSPNDYIQTKRAKCDELFDKEININEMKNIYFNKYFGMSLTKAEQFYKKYVMNYDKVVTYATSDIALLFVNLITKIINIQDPITLRELYMTNDIYYDITDIYEIESIMSNAYFASLVNDYKDKQNGELIKKTFKYNDNEEEIEMIELVDNFGLLVHSTCAYGQMPMIDNDYYQSWNYNPNTENHGICCSYITNSSYGTADVTGNGVMFGFTNLTINSVAEYSPFDLSTSNQGFNISCIYEPFYTLLNDIPNYTRHTHNEFDLERRIPNDKHFCVQPDCIIIFEDMPDEIKSNSIKAYYDFKANGIDLKIYYMDRVKIAKMEASKLTTMIDEYCNSKDLNMLEKIINKYESNICGCDFLSVGNSASKELFDKDELFMTERISNLLFETLEEINELKDIDKFIYYVSILEHEQFKFDLIYDENDDRRHTFKLYSYELKLKIEEVKQNMNINEKENTK